jgi:hypothetical protein
MNTAPHKAVREILTLALTLVSDDFAQRAPLVVRHPEQFRVGDRSDTFDECKFNNSAGLTCRGALCRYDHGTATWRM